jgi:hypothetical protein
MVNSVVHQRVISTKHRGKEEDDGKAGWMMSERKTKQKMHERGKRPTEDI